MPRRPYDALFIDFYGTISAGDRVAVETACARIVTALDLPVTAGELAIIWGERFFAVIDSSNHDAFQTLQQCELDSLRDTLAGFGRDADPVPLVVDIERYWVDPPLHDDAAEFLSRLDLPVCCVSNADTRPLLAAIEKHGLRFDAVISSQAARCYKPDPGIFRMALNALGADPARVMHVGDSLHSDVAGAAKLGLKTTWLRREDRIHDIGTCKPDHTIATLADLPALLS